MPRSIYKRALINCSVRRVVVMLLLLIVVLLSGTNINAAQESQPLKLKPYSFPPGTREHLDVEYIPGGHERQRLDLFLPKSGEKFPLLIVVHGGGFSSGSKERLKEDFPTKVATEMLNRGFAVATVGYRLSQHAIFPAQIEDCKTAVRFLRANAQKYGLDPERFGAWGTSAGGHLVTMLGVAGDARDLEGQSGYLSVSSKVQAVCDMYGPSDILRMNVGRLSDERDHDAPDSPNSRLLGGPVQENKERARRASPVTYVSADDPPFLIMHGDRDPTVPYHQSVILHEAMRKAGVDVTFRTIKGGAHGGPLVSTPETLRLIVDFFEKHLRSRSER